VNLTGDNTPVYNPQDTPGYNPFGHPYPTSPTPPPKHYDSGPPRKGKSSKKPAPAPPPDPWAGVPGAVRDQANAIVDKFLATVGYPQGLDANSIAQQLAKSSVNITGSPFDAYQWLYDNILGVKNPDLAKNSPWAAFGMGKDDYTQTVSKLDSVYSNWTGEKLSTQNLGANGGLWSGSPLWQAIRGSWTPDQIRNFAMFGNAEGTGPLLADAQMTGADPWIGMGQTYTQTLQGFQTFEGSTPTDKATLAAWFRFGASTKQLGGQQATQQATQKPLYQPAEVR